MGRRYPKEAMVGVGGIVFSGRKVLLVKRGRPPSKGFWSIPGGKLRLGEGLKEAVKREIKEETGLDVECKRLVDVVERIIRDDKGRIEYHYVIVDFLCNIIAGNLKPGSDVMDAKFFDITSLPTDKLTKGAYDIIQKAITIR